MTSRSDGRGARDSSGAPGYGGAARGPTLHHEIETDMTRADRLRGYYDRKRETMGVRARRAYQEEWVRGAGGPCLAARARRAAAHGGGGAPAGRRADARPTSAASRS